MRGWWALGRWHQGGGEIFTIYPKPQNITQHNATQAQHKTEPQCHHEVTKCFKHCMYAALLWLVQHGNAMNYIDDH